MSLPRAAATVRHRQHDDDDDDPGMDSDNSMPSLQTVSDSSDGEFQSDDEVDEDEDDYVSEEDEDGRASDMPRLIPVSDDPPRPPSPAARLRDWARSMPDRFYGDSEDEEGALNGDTRPLPGDVGALLRALIGLDRPSASPASDPVLRGFINAIQQSHPAIYQHMTMSQNRPDKDPQRAQTIIAALERVPQELIGRYEKLRAGHGEDDFEGCPICRESLLLDPPLTGEDDAPSQVLFAELPFHDSEALILAFPCPGKHVFHDTCLSPWLARKTTCPSCRFDVDPDSLTLRIESTLPPNTTMPPGYQPPPPRPRPAWQPPKTRPFNEWLEGEEKKALDPLPVPPRVKSSVASVPPPAMSAPGPSYSPMPTLAAPSGVLPLGRHTAQAVDDNDDEWITDDEGDEEDALPARTPGPSSTPSQTVHRRDPNDPAFLAERRRFLRDLIGPHNPLQLFLGDADVPTLIPFRRRASRERTETHDDEDDDDDDEPPPLERAVFAPSGSTAPSLFSLTDSVEEALDGVDEDDDLPLLVGEEASTGPHRRPEVAPWLQPNRGFNPARDFEMLTRWERDFAQHMADSLQDESDEPSG